MATTDTNVTSVLNGLIETCKDGEEGFRQAADKAKEPRLKSLFLKYATQRGEYVQELQQLVSSMGEKPETSGHIAAGLHRGWIGLKAAVSQDDDKAIIDECEAGEDAAMKKLHRSYIERPTHAGISVGCATVLGCKGRAWRDSRFEAWRDLTSERLIEATEDRTKRAVS